MSAGDTCSCSTTVAKFLCFPRARGQWQVSPPRPRRLAPHVRREIASCFTPPHTATRRGAEHTTLMALESGTHTHITQQGEHPGHETHSFFETHQFFSALTAARPARERHPTWRRQWSGARERRGRRRRSGRAVGWERRSPSAEETSFGHGGAVTVPGEGGTILPWHPELSPVLADAGVGVGVGVLFRVPAAVEYLEFYACV